MQVYLGMAERHGHQLEHLLDGIRDPTEVRQSSRRRGILLRDTRKLGSLAGLFSGGSSPSLTLDAPNLRERGRGRGGRLILLDNGQCGIAVRLDKGSRRGLGKGWFFGRRCRNSGSSWYWAVQINFASSVSGPQALHRSIQCIGTLSGYAFRDDAQNGMVPRVPRSPLQTQDSETRRPQR